jgi:hypothetical protein
VPVTAICCELPPASVAAQRPARLADSPDVLHWHRGGFQLAQGDLQACLQQVLDDDIVGGDLGMMVAGQGRSGASDPASAMELLDHWL